MIAKLQAAWVKVQEFLDVNGDAWMSIFTGAIVFRIVAAKFGAPSITAAESAVYASAVGMFGYSKTRPK